jgi:moderate conductance mechanosensitive channel
MASLCLLLGTTLAAAAPAEPSAKTGGPGIAAAAKVPEARGGGSDANRTSKAIAFMRSLDGGQLSSLSDAEWVAYYLRNLKADKKYLDQLNTFLQKPGGLFIRAEAAFEAINERYRTLEVELAAGRAKGQVDRDARIGAELEELRPVRDLFKKRFDLAIERRRLIRQLIPVVERRVGQIEETLARTMGEVERPPNSAIPDEPPAPTAAAVPGQGRPPAVPGFPPGVISPNVVPPPSPASEVPAEAAERQKTLRISQEYALAQAEVDKWVLILAELQKSLHLLEDRLETVDEAMALEKGLQDNAHHLFDNAEAIRTMYSERFQERSLSGAPAETLETLRRSLREATELAQELRELSRTSSDRLTNLGESRGFVREALVSRKKDADRAQAELAKAQLGVARISNPFHPRNLYRWFLDHGPRILAILVTTILLYLAVHILGSRIVRAIASRGLRGSKEESLDRANTLVGAFRQSATLAVLAGSTLMILDEIGIPIGPLLGGAAVVGLAVAFGAQSLIKDFFQGFMIIIENQYKLNDVVKIGTYSGTVEQITLRTTVLRGLDGTLHFIPNGQINAVSNMTHGWSRALFDLRIAYREDVDKVIEVILQECGELHRDPHFGPLILEGATMLGVDDFADSAVVIKFYIKTVPLQQWKIRRELLRRIKTRFDSDGIEFPLPHRSIDLRSADGSPIEESLREAFAADGRGTARE